MPRVPHASDREDRPCQPVRRDGTHDDAGLVVRVAERGQQRASTAALTVRPVSAVDAPALAVLARLDSARPLTGPCLVAEVDGRPVAALAVDDGRVVADPFGRSADAVAMLRLRARQAATPARRLVALRREPRLGFP